MKIYDLTCKNCQRLQKQRDVLLRVCQNLCQANREEDASARNMMLDAAMQEAEIVIAKAKKWI